MPIFLLTTAAPTIATKVATVAVNLYFYGHVINDSFKVGKRIGYWLENRRQNLKNAAYQGAKQGAAEAQAHA